MHNGFLFLKGGGLFLLFLFLCPEIYAQEDLVIYMKSNDAFTAHKDSADFTRIISTTQNDQRPICTQRILS